MNHAAIVGRQRDEIRVGSRTHIRRRRWRRCGEHLEVTDDGADLVVGVAAGRHDAAGHAVANDLQDAIVVAARCEEIGEIGPVQAAAVGAVARRALLAEQRPSLVESLTARESGGATAAKAALKHKKRRRRDDTAHERRSILPAAYEDLVTRSRSHCNRRSRNRRRDCQRQRAAKQLRRRHAVAARRQGDADAAVEVPGGSRSNWHSHSSGQLLMIEEGLGRTQDRNGPLLEMTPGRRGSPRPASSTGTARRPIRTWSS